MIDPFRPLKITEEAMKVEDKTYATSWLDTEEKLFTRQKSRVKPE